MTKGSTPNTHTAMKLLENPKVLGLKVLFPLGPTYYQWWVRTNSLKLDAKIIIIIK